MDPDPRRPGRIVRFSKLSSMANPDSETGEPVAEDLMSDYMNVLSMVFSMCAFMMKIKWCGWIAIFCSCISFTNTKSSTDTKQIMSSFMLSISSVVMSYMQSPKPMALAFAS